MVVGVAVAVTLAGEDAGDDLQAWFVVVGNATCAACSMNSACGKGCPAAVIAAGGRIGEVDAEQCPVVDDDHAEGRRLLPLIPA